jgi:hypothetical protein
MTKEEIKAGVELARAKALADAREIVSSEVGFATDKLMFGRERVVEKIAAAILCGEARAMQRAVSMLRGSKSASVSDCLRVFTSIITGRRR